MTATMMSSFLQQKDPIIAEPIKKSAIIRDTREKRTIPKFKEDEYQFSSSLATFKSMGPENSSALNNFLEYGVYRS